MSFGNRDMDVPAVILLILLVGLVLVLMPVVTIWSLNTLFDLGIAYGVAQWLAVAWLSMLCFGGVRLRVNRKE